MKQIPNAKEFNLLSWLHHRPFKNGVSCRSARNAEFSPAIRLTGLSTLFLTAWACAAILMPSTSQAALMAYEGFNYPSASDLTGQSGGFGWNGFWQTVVTSSSSVTSGSLVAGANAPSGYDSHSVGNAAFTPNGTREGRFLDTSAGGSFGQAGYIGRGGNIGAAGKTIYISFMQQPSVADNNYYEFEFHRGDLNDGGRVGGVGCDTGGSTNVYLRTPAAAQTVIGPASTAVSFYVVRIDFMANSNDTVTVYQDPTSATEGGATPSLVEANAGDMSFNGISFGAFVLSTTVTHDEVRIGTSWADVVSPGAYSTGTWDGGGANNNWSTGGNWDNDMVPVFASSLTFAGSTGLNNTNDLTDISANNITFNSAAGAFTLNGNSLGLNGNIGFSANPASLITQTINLPLAPSVDITVDTPANGNMAIGGNITSSHWLTKIDDGTLTLAGTNTFIGLSSSGGTNIITGNTAFTGGGAFYVADGPFIHGCKGTVIIQPGATLTVIGDYSDAGVIGRDSGSGTIIQNGGTFSFAANPGSNPYLYIGASSDTSTRSEYDMNGGVFDMNGENLGIALGAGVLITGVVNQVGGVITNVGNLIFNPITDNGHGIYNLTGGSIYIGSGGMTLHGLVNGYEVNLGGGTIAAQASWSSSLDINLTGVNGPVTFNPAGYTITLSGVLSGPGGLAVSGGGTLELSGANTYTGDTTINAGSILQLDATGSSAGAFNVADGGVLYLNFSGTFAVGSFYTNGVALPVGTYNSSSLPGYITGSGNLDVTSGISTGHWTGLGGDNNWSTGGNWDNNAVPIFPHALVFDGSTRLTNYNDLTGITVSSIKFGTGAGPFELDGNDITLSDGISFSNNPPAPVTQTINLNMTWNADKTIDTPTNGNITLGGNITASANQLTKIDAGTLALGGNDSFASYMLNGGTNIITGSVTVNGTGSSVFYLGNGSTSYNGTLVIQPGAALNVSGSFGDALVIGRNGGSGTVIQNGGTFTYAGSATYLFVGATSNPGTQAEYDMNGGVLDMNGNTLGVALGDNGVAYAAVLNQTGGAINNVYTLDLGAVRAYGQGVYNLTGGSITIDFGGIISDSGSYAINLGGGTIGAYSSWSSSLNMTLTGSNGPVTFSPAGNTITLSGILSGPGGLVVAGGGILELSGTNNYTGDTTVNAGNTLQLDSTGGSPGAFRLANGATLYLNFSGIHPVNGLYTNGVALPNGIYDSSNLPGFITGSGQVQVQNVSSGLWTGAGTDNNWSTAGNWNNNAVPVFPIGLTFAGSTRLANNNDLTGITVNSIMFDSAAGAFVIGGNDITLNGNIGFNGNPAAPITQTANFNMVWNASKTVDIPANGNLSLGGNITNAGYDLTKTGDGTLTLGGVDSFAGYAVNGGTTTISGNVTANGTGGSRFVLANGNSAYNGTLIIQPGATFDVIGDWTDAGVIGRDGGKGTVIQNGGMFNFNMANQSWLFVGAAGFSGTIATYDMNGGLLDMNGKNLGIALAVNGVTITGAVNQTGGVITNVGQLDLGVVGGQLGNGQYNLTGGSLYIGANGIISDSGIYQMNLGGGTIGAGANWSSPLNMTLTGINGPVTFSPAGNTITLSGSLSGVGGLTMAGSGGTLELSGANSYTGDTTVNAGSTLKLDSTSNGSGTFKLASGAMLNLNYSGTINMSACYTNGVPLPSGVYTSANLPGFITGAGSLTIPAPPSPSINSPYISGGKLILTGSGGTAGAGYTWLTTTNLAAPITWTTNTTGNFDGSGNFSNAIPVNVSTPARFFQLRTP